MTPQEIAAAIRQEADLAARPGQMKRLDGLADAVLALTEQQPEPVTRQELVDLIEEFNERPGRLLYQLSRYTITRKPQESRVVSSPDGDSR